MGASNSIEKLRAAIDRRLSQPLPTSRNTHEDLVSLIRLNVKDHVRTYDRNPRQAVNEKYLEIKESIRSRGLDNMVTVTKRPGENFYMPAKGGNTRIQILHELIEEGCTQFTQIDFREIPWPGEVKMLAAHIVENEQRADLCFWDKAHSIFIIKEEIEKEQGEEFSLRKFSEYLKEKEGIQVSPVLLSYYSFAVRNLGELGQGARLLSLRDVREKIVPGRSAIINVIHKLQCKNVDEAVIKAAWEAAINVARVTAEKSSAFDAQRLIDAFTEQIAARLGVSLDEITRMQQVLATGADLEGEALRDAISLSKARWTPLPTDEQNEQNHQSGDGLREKGQNSNNGTLPAAPHAADKNNVRMASTPAGVMSNVEVGTTSTAVTSSTSSTLPDLSHSFDHAQNDPANQLRAAVMAFLRACKLDVNCYVETELLPLGFMLDFPPDLSEKGPSLLDQNMGGDRSERYWGWWFIVNLTYQNSPEGLAVLPPTTRYGQTVASDEAWQNAVENMVGEPAYDSYGDALLRIMNPQRPNSDAYTDLVWAVRLYKRAFPQRFTIDFWRHAGVPENFLEKLIETEGL